MSIFLQTEIDNVAIEAEVGGGGLWIQEAEDLKAQWASIHT